MGYRRNQAEKKHSNRSRGRLQYKSCERKRRYRSEFDARKDGNKFGLRAYECPFCRGWHLSSME